LRIISLNLNGIRSAVKKGFIEWLHQQDADVVCVQELKAQAQDLAHEALHVAGYFSYFHCAEKKGYSGVGIYSRQPAITVKTGLGWAEADSEGRYVEIKLPKVSIASLYLPSGTMGDVRQAFKYDFLKRFSLYLLQLRASQDEHIICGDWNIAHRVIDLKNWRSNQKNTGFLPEERAWMDELYDKLGFIDAFRHVNQEPDQYTWWSNRGQAWAKNVGWRIDCQVVTPGLKDKIRAVSIYKEQRFSDHAPLIIDYDI
jgi:exodeoxyribonuclease-3